MNTPPRDREAEPVQHGDDADYAVDELFRIAMYGDRGNPKGMRAEIRAALSHITDTEKGNAP